MIHLPRARDAWNSPDFKRILKFEVEQLGARQLPLQQGLSATSYALDDGFEVMVLRAAELDDRIQAKVGVFFSGITAGCNCANDPTPVEPQNEYCELMIDIDKATAQATVRLAS